jgi:hypothetical protein
MPASGTSRNGAPPHIVGRDWGTADIDGLVGAMLSVENDPPRRERFSLFHHIGARDSRFLVVVLRACIIGAVARTKQSWLRRQPGLPVANSPTWPLRT